MPLVTNTSNVYSDIDLSFNVNPNSKDVSTLLDASAVKRAIRHTLLLNKYDIPFDSTKYSNVNKILFEPISYITSSVLESAIKFAITQLDSRITIINIKVVDPLNVPNAEFTVSFIKKNYYKDEAAALADANLSIRKRLNDRKKQIRDS
jgi:phage baseplate assembly protein W